MMSLRERVYRVVKAHGEPISSQSIARKMRVDPRRIFSDVSKLASYGYLIRERTTTHRINQGAQVTRHFYIVSGKEYP